MIKIMTEMSWPVRDDQTFLGTSPHITSSTARARGHQTKQRNIKYFQEIHHHSRYFSVKMSERICSTKNLSFISLFTRIIWYPKWNIFGIILFYITNSYYDQNFLNRPKGLRSERTSYSIFNIIYPISTQSSNA